MDVTGQTHGAYDATECPFKAFLPVNYPDIPIVGRQSVSVSALFCCQRVSNSFHRNRLGLKENLSIADWFSWPGPRPRPQWPLLGQQPVILSVINQISACLIAPEVMV